MTDSLPPQDVEATLKAAHAEHGSLDDRWRETIKNMMEANAKYLIHTWQFYGLHYVPVLSPMSGVVAHWTIVAPTPKGLHNRRQVVDSTVYTDIEVALDVAQQLNVTRRSRMCRFNTRRCPSPEMCTAEQRCEAYPGDENALPR